ncbi:unnamed protein product [Rotaria magnacalcarata]|uniref:Uncharacterized protein n=2 Tax=Rotaria magnacalcarata TaxID=392030 RepID=A0A818XFP3_9BILA|nr:unnamed protein product [Rotaria magnacalcarata]CAF3742891.1 unnamed protein product [Rotaria magnacalcarata]CAF3848704.1 unnamed protein product [Rotaria magnacalcarata]CAF3861730.1 unnamed protein product [Rotaria magnacalcarata]
MYQGKLAFFFLPTIILIGQYESTPLDDYVNAPDPHFGWTIIDTYEAPDYKLYILNFTSQKWIDERFSSRSIWWHYLCITVPNRLTRPNTAFLLIDGGSNTDGIPKPNDESVELMSMLALGTGSITADLQDVPNNDPTNQTRNDNAALAWTWKAFIDNQSNPAILMHLPMTKASIRAMDAIQNFTAHLSIPVPETFIVGGASKRGWTTWNAASVDPKRVIGATPIVMDLLNLQSNLHHLYRSLVGWTFALKDFYALDIFPFIDTDNFTQMAKIIDPFNYFNRYKSIKTLQIQTTGDEFFLLDNEIYAFWKELQLTTGGTYLRRIPNAEHQCIGHLISIVLTIQSFYLSVYDNKPLPSLTWIKSSNNTHGYIRATIDFSVGPKPISAIGYRARTLNEKRRDFRLFIADPSNPVKPMPNPVFWFTTSLVTEAQTNTTIVCSLAIEYPQEGWEGFFIQVNFPGPNGSVLELTTETQIVPDTYPTDDCHNESCAGTLV